jgi:hypothetical protein
MERSRGRLAFGASVVIGVVVAIACSSEKSNPAPDSGTLADASVVADTAAPQDTSSPGVDTSAPDDVNVDDVADSAACGLSAPIQSEACTKCLTASCCAETANCFGDAKCKALDDCVNTCLTSNGGDAGSISACAQRCNDSADANVRIEWRSYNDCLALKCVRNGAGPCQ